MILLMIESLLTNNHYWQRINLIKQLSMHESPLIIIASFSNAHHMHETVGKEHPKYTIHNNLKGRYFYSHFIVKETG